MQYKFQTAGKIVLVIANTDPWLIHSASIHFTSNTTQLCSDVQDLHRWWKGKKKATKLRLDSSVGEIWVGIDGDADILANESWPERISKKKITRRERKKMYHSFIKKIRKYTSGS